MKKINSNLILLFFLIVCKNVFSQSITVDSYTYTPEQLVKEILITGSVQVFNIKFTGANNAIGYFSGGEEGVCFESGIILSTGNVSNAKGPNKYGNVQTAFGTPGDADLNTALNRYTQDAAVLEFDFIPISDSIKFEYIWGSDEYPEYVHQGFNDVFGFFLTGPDPAGGEYINKNIAVLPGTTTIVSIDNVNSYTNKEYYINNSIGKNIEFDGITIPLTALINVVPAETYHIKLAVGDVNDMIYDSGVFLKATSFYGGSSLSYEGECFNMATHFFLSNDDLIDSVFWDFGDPDSEPDNTSREKNPEHVFSKGGSFEVTVITYSFGYADTLVEVVNIAEYEIDLGADLLIRQGDTVVLDAGHGGLIYHWNTGSDNQKIYVLDSGLYWVEVIFPDSCMARDEIRISYTEKNECTCLCCILGLIFGVLMAIISLLLYLKCRGII